VHDKRKEDLLVSLEDPVFIAFLADISQHALNLKLQGPQQILSGQVKEISAFEAKLHLFITQLQQSNFTHFPQLSKVDKTNRETCT